MDIMKRQMRNRIVGAALLVAVVSLCGNGCAVFNSDKTRLLNVVENRVWPENKAVQIVSAPVLFPLGIGAITLDAAIIQPATVVDDAVMDTYKINKFLGSAWWQNCDWEESYALECMLAPLRVAGTVVTNGPATGFTFVGSFITRGYWFPFTEF